MLNISLVSSIAQMDQHIPLRHFYGLMTVVGVRDYNESDEFFGFELLDELIFLVIFMRILMFFRSLE